MGNLRHCDAFFVPPCLGHRQHVPVPDSGSILTSINRIPCPFFGPHLPDSTRRPIIWSNIFFPLGIFVTAATDRRRDDNLNNVNKSSSTSEAVTLDSSRRKSGGRGRGENRRRGGSGGGSSARNKRGKNDTASTSASREAPIVAAWSGTQDTEWKMVPHVVLKAGKGRLFRDGNPLVFSGALQVVVFPEEAEKEDCKDRGNDMQMQMQMHSETKNSQQTTRLTTPVFLLDEELRCLGWGLWNPHSMYAVRMFQFYSTCRNVPALVRDGGESEGHNNHHTVMTSPPAIQLEQWIASSIKSALKLRAALGLFCSSSYPCSGLVSTNAFRVVNGEADRLGGLAIDYYAGVFVVMAYATWVQLYKGTIIAAIQQAARAVQGKAQAELAEKVPIVWKISQDKLKKDGWIRAGSTSTSSSGNSNMNSIEDGDEVNIENEDEDEDHDNASGAEELVSLTSTTTSHSSQHIPELLDVVENDIKFRVALLYGQKTGHYNDQRETRMYIRSLSRGKRVLDAFCYTGGFALNCCKGGAEHVVGVDSSSAALDIAKQNQELNEIPDDVLKWVKSDVLDYLRAYRTQEQSLFDVVILDPPKFAPNKESLKRATNKYKRLNMLALRVIKEDGLLVTCTCSSAMSTTPGMFMEMVREAASDTGKEVTLLKTLGQAADHVVHPALMEGAYLTCYVLAVRSLTQF